MKSPAPLVYRWPSALVPATFERRYERFLADVRLDDGSALRVHCVNSGRMEGLVVPGARVWLSRAATPGRALTHTWEIIEQGGLLVGANTGIPNTVVKAVLEQKLLPGLEDVTVIRPEAPFGEGQRVDFLLQQPGGPHHLEVKNCHLVYPDGRGYFPDSRSERATHHVEALEALVEAGGRATVLFTVQRTDVVALRPSHLHDPAFAQALTRAAAKGLAVRALKLEPTLEGLRLLGEVPVDLSAWSVDAVRPWAEALCATSGWARKDGKVAGQALPVGKAAKRARPG